MFPILFRIGNFELHTYGVLVACAVLIGIWVSIKEARRRQINIDRFLDILFWVIIGGIFGARIWYLAWYDPYLLVTKPWEIVMLWHGGMAIHGAIAGGIIVAIITARKTKIGFWKFTDTIAPGMLLGQAIGRLGCTCAGCCYGRPTDLWWGITFTNPESLANPLGVPLYPTQPLEAVLNAAGFVLLWQLRSKKLSDGVLFLIYVCYYSVVRFLLEYLRGDVIWLFSRTLTFGQLLCVISIAVAVSLILYLRRRQYARSI